MSRPFNHRSAVALSLSVIAALGMQCANAGDEPTIPWDEAEVFFELNDTDGDLGIHAKIDGDEWRTLEIEDLIERSMLNIRVSGRLRRQGLTEIFFESAEPQFDELAPETFFARFPAGMYEVSGLTLDGEELESITELTHAVPAPPQTQVNGVGQVEDCDEDKITVVSAPVTISWEPVTTSHPDLGGADVVPIDVVSYEVVVEIDDTPFKSATLLPASASSFTVPAEIVALGSEIKYEVLVRESSYNQTAVESCFCVDTCGD